MSKLFRKKPSTILQKLHSFKLQHNDVITHLLHLLILINISKLFLSNSNFKYFLNPSITFINISLNLKVYDPLHFLVHFHLIYSRSNIQFVKNIPLILYK